MTSNFYCYILIPKKSPRKAPFKPQCSPPGSAIPTQCRVAVAVWKHGFPECWWPWNRKPWFATILTMGAKYILIKSQLRFYTNICIFTLLFFSLNWLVTKNQILNTKFQTKFLFVVSIQKFLELNLNATANKCWPHCGARRGGGGGKVYTLQRRRGGISVHLMSSFMIEAYYIAVTVP